MAINFATSGLDLLVQILRYRISDLKASYSTVTAEDVGTANGNSNEVFYTTNMPVASGFETYLRVGRWFYTKKETELECAGARSYVFHLESGAFRIPAGATLAESGSRVRVGYTWEEEQEYKFSDKELKLYIGDAITAVNSDCNFGYTFISTGNFDVSPMVEFNSIAAHAYPLYASILIKRQLESEGFGDRIYVKDLNITIDTSKGLGDLSKSTRELESKYSNLINDCRLSDQLSAVQNIDTYSTYPIYGSHRYATNYVPDTSFGQSE